MKEVYFKHNLKFIPLGSEDFLDLAEIVDFLMLLTGNDEHDEVLLSSKFFGRERKLSMTGTEKKQRLVARLFLLSLEQNRVKRKARIFFLHKNMVFVM